MRMHAYNNLTCGRITVTMLGDMTGPKGVPDGRVDVRDVSAVAKLFGACYHDLRYNGNCDINDDGKIDMKDISTVAKHFENATPDVSSRAQLSIS